MTSIRGRLFLVLMLMTGLVWLSGIVWIDLSTRAKLEHVLDARLIEAARMVQSLMVTPADASARLNHGTLSAHRPYERQLACQIWSLDGALIGRSGSAPVTPMSPAKSGFSDTVINGARWRVYATVDDQTGVRVLVGDSLAMRDRLTSDVIRGLALPALLILPVLALLTWLCVQRGLAPLRRLAHTLSHRRAADLTPLDASGLPTEIRPLVDALNGLLNRVTAARDHERDFTAFAAHELRTPIAGLKTQAQIAVAARQEAVRLQALNQMIISVDRTARLVRQLTDLTGVENGRSDDAAEPVDMGPFLAALTMDMGADGFEIAPELARAQLRVPPERLALAARNLLDNARNHAPPGRPVRVSLHDAQDWVAMVIEDDGPGIPPEDLPKVRDRFFRGQYRSPVGSGLGLAIVDMAMDRMGGSLHLETRPSGGLRAEMRLA
ncbi:ATP-binding protein, partial [Asticcacaulis sp. EMRT-3]|uniref:ATP-binding protein n=1 Tax=Asticcacaulis sp. EMRT-3 TaxID=3040349 RepID=UPI0024AF37FC